MNTNQLAVHEVEGRLLRLARDGRAEYVAALGAEFADIARAGVPGDLLPLRSHVYRTAAALLSVYRSRVDFLAHRALDTGGESLRYRVRPMPALTGPEPVATR